MKARNRKKLAKLQRATCSSSFIFCAWSLLWQLTTASIEVSFVRFSLFSLWCRNNHRAKSNDPTYQVKYLAPSTTFGPLRRPLKCSSRALLVSSSKSFAHCELRLEAFCRFSPKSLPLRRFAVFRVRAFHTKKKMKDPWEIYLKCWGGQPEDMAAWCGVLRATRTSWRLVFILTSLSISKWAPLWN